jgi:hypothetical protein
MENHPDTCRNCDGAMRERPSKYCYHCIIEIYGCTECGEVDCVCAECELCDELECECDTEGESDE